MDLGLNGKRAIVCGASAGLGYACAEALVAEGVQVLLIARTPAPLQAAADRLNQVALNAGLCRQAAAHEQAAATPPAQWLVADVSQAEGRAGIRAHWGDADILITNAAGPPPGDFRQWVRDDWLKALDANMLAPIELIKAYVDGMMARGFGRIINITSSAVKSPLDPLGLSNGARSGLTGFVAGLARKTVAQGVTINNLLPGTFDTARLASNFAAQAAREGRSADDVRQSRIAKHPARRLGQAQELGATCAFLCGQQAGYITGQNILLDAGSYPGTF
jgi:3-oxoacyl-[acyl-carrier protein] reductase